MEKELKHLIFEILTSNNAELDFVICQLQDAVRDEELDNGIKAAVEILESLKDYLTQEDFDEYIRSIEN